MNERWPFTVHKDDKFDPLLKKLQSLDILDLSSSNEDDTKQIHIKDAEILFEVFRTIFVLYATPNERHISFTKQVKRLTSKGEFLNLSLIDNVSVKANELLATLITKEGDDVYEASFKALLAVYLGSLRPLDFIYPNTYISELGRDTHEIDILLGWQNKECLMIETTRGFDKQTDKIDETYLWYFKKSLFRKWILEKLYSVQCTLSYITLKSLGQQPKRSPNFSGQLLDESQSTLDSPNQLIEKILQHEGETIHLINLEEHFKRSLTIEEIGYRLKEEVLEKLANLFGH